MLCRTFILRGPEQAAGLHAFLKQNAGAMAASGTPLAVTVTEHKAKRSGDQNRRYWMILSHIAATAWVGGKQFSAEAWHEYFKGRLIGLERTPDGRQVGISTTTLSVGEFDDYMTSAERYAIDELGIELP